MMDYSETQIIELRNRISELEMENRLLKERMDEAGISYGDIVSDSDNAVAGVYDQNQGARIKKLSFDILQVLIISNNTGSSVLDMVYETGIGSSD